MRDMWVSSAKCVALEFLQIKLLSEREATCQKNTNQEPKEEKKLKLKLKKEKTRSYNNKLQ